MKRDSWKHPIHARGIRSPQFFGGHIRGQLTDRQIAKYLREGFYEARGVYLKEKKRLQAEKNIFRLVYDCDKQDFVKVWS